jgi:hypothetical protein
MEQEKDIIFVKRILKIYQFVIVLTPVYITFSYLTTLFIEQKKNLKIDQYGFQGETRNYEDITIFILAFLFLFSLPFFIWTIRLNKRIKDKLTSSQSNQLIILGLFPVAVYLYYDFKIIIAMIKSLLL